MKEDRALQFRLFWQALGATAIVLSLFFSLFRDGGSWSEVSFFLLIPHIFLIPASLIILNRAKSLNRKSAYLIYVSDRREHSWERDLASYRRVPDRPKTMFLILFTLVVVEVLCMFIFVGAIVVPKEPAFVNIDEILFGLYVLYAMFHGYMIAKRVAAYYCMRYSRSIQHMVERWRERVGRRINPLRFEWDAVRWTSVLAKEARGKKWGLVLASLVELETDESGSVIRKVRIAKIKSMAMAVFFYGTYFCILYAIIQESNMRELVSLAVGGGLALCFGLVLLWGWRRQRRVLVAVMS